MAASLSTTSQTRNRSTMSGTWLIQQMVSTSFSLGTLAIATLCRRSSVLNDELVEGGLAATAHEVPRLRDCQVRVKQDHEGAPDDCRVPDSDWRHSPHRVERCSRPAAAGQQGLRRRQSAEWRGFQVRRSVLKSRQGWHPKAVQNAMFTEDSYRYTGIEHTYSTPGCTVRLAQGCVTGLKVMTVNSDTELHREAPDDCRSGVVATIALLTTLPVRDCVYSV